LTYRLGILGEEFIVRLIHRREVVHGRDEDVDFYDIGDAAAGFLEDGRQVLQSLPLEAVNSPEPQSLAEAVTYRPIRDGTFHLTVRLGVDADVPGAIDHAVVLDGLGELGKRLRRLGGEDALDLLRGRHFEL
jgi:hypothetical protein